MDVMLGSTWAYEQRDELDMLGFSTNISVYLRNDAR